MHGPHASHSGHEQLLSQLSAVLTQHINDAKGSFSIVLTPKPRLHVAVNKAGLARGRNFDKSYRGGKNGVCDLQYGPRKRD